jgi:methylmalonyl-CoA mutase C-terminal domain/subunit
VIVAKPGLDGHDRGAKVVARALAEAGMEVIYTGIRQTPEMIVSTALQEDADCIGLSTLSGSHVEHSGDIIRLLSEANASDIAVIVGGIVPREDMPALQDLGVKAVFGPGASTAGIIETITRLATEKRSVGQSRLASPTPNV